MNPMNENGRVEFLLSNRENFLNQAYLFPRDFDSITEGIRDIEGTQRYLFDKLMQYRDGAISVYINGGRMKEILAIVQVCNQLNIELYFYHYNDSKGNYEDVPQKVEWNPCSHTENVAESEDKVVLFRGRHWKEDAIAVYEEALTEQQIFAFDELKEIAVEKLQKYKGMSLNIYLSGIKSAAISVLNATCELDIDVSFMHYDFDTESYFPQRMNEITIVV